VCVGVENVSGFGVSDAGTRAVGVGEGVTVGEGGDVARTLGVGVVSVAESVELGAGESVRLQATASNTKASSIDP
jgi:hypothetical protein